MDRKDEIKFWKDFRNDAIVAKNLSEEHINGLESEPERRHGDYGTGQNHDRIIIGNDIYNEMNCKNPTGRDESRDVWIGNIFDDLKAMTEDIEEFEVKANGIDKGFAAKISNKSLIDMGTTDDKWAFNLPKAEEIHRKLGALIYKLKRA